MSEQWICPDQVFDGAQVRTGVALRLSGGRVAEVADRSQKAGQSVAGCVSPGYVDLQVNGGGGVLLNTAPVPDTITTMAAAHRQFGTVAILPTVITDRPEVLEQATDAVLAVQAQDGIIGLHIEGPHIAMARRGTHNPGCIRPFDGQTEAVVARLRAAGLPVMITVAPEAISTAQITCLARMGAVVSLGHTDATADQIRHAIGAGARCGTHLFNAMSPIQSRSPGAVGAILNAGIPFGMICDGHHVDDEIIKLALRAAAAPDCAFLVSDAMATIGGPDRFQLYGQEVRLQDGRLINAEGNLAGAHITQARGVQRLVVDVGISVEDALRMAITVPAQVIGRPDLATLVGRSVDDLIVLSDDLAATDLGTHLAADPPARHAAS